VIQLVEQGHGYTLLPYLATHSLQKTSRRLVKRFSSPVPSREVSLVYRRTQYKQPILDALFNEVQESLPEELPRAKGKGIEVIRI
jgi:LysR family hydrogen peroxide-inducible transcriptional activator